MLVVVVGVVWIPLRRSALGLSLYALGSDRLAAFRSGVAVGRTKIIAYALTGLFCALGGLAVTASTGSGSPVPGAYTLQSVAAIVLGGVSLAGGRGGILGPIIAVFILQLVRTDLTFLEVEPELLDRRPGRDPHRRRPARQRPGDAEGPAMSAGVGTADPRNPWLTADAWRRLFRDRPLVPLTGLLVVLVVALQLVRPGIVTADWLGVTLRAAVPLAILAGCQTLCMLTGGIDLSVGAVASMAAFVMATLATEQGPFAAIAIGLVAAALAGLVNGVGIGVFKVHPLIMTLGMGLVLLGPDVGLPAGDGPEPGVDVSRLRSNGSAPRRR